MSLNTLSNIESKSETSIQINKKIIKEVDDENVLSLNEDEYDDCKDLDEYYDTSNKNKTANKNTSTMTSLLNNSKNMKATKYERNPISPMKRNKINDSTNEEESPKKKFKMPTFNNPTVRQFNLSENNFSPKTLRSTSLCENPTKKSFASTPKSERKPQKSRVKELTEQDSLNSAAIERNLSNNWGDILEELEEQTKEFNDYVEKVTLKFKLDKEKLINNIESDAETLRKRQKRINFGKVTPEYQRYVLEVTRKNRQPYHPRTPNKFRKCSRRKFDGLIKKWRKLLHVWDENPEALKDYKHSIENDDENGDITDEFGEGISYIVDDYDLIEDENVDDANQKTTTNNS